MDGDAGRGTLSLSSWFGGGRLFDVSGALAILLFLIAFQIMAIWGLIGAVLAPFNQRDVYATDPIEVDLGTVGYSIPGNYVLVDRTGGSSSYRYVKLMVLRRGFEPRTGENAAEWKTWDENGRQVGSGKPGGTVTITISNTGSTRVGTLDHHVRHGAYPAEPSEFGLVRYAGGYLDGSRRAYYVSEDGYGAGSGGPAIVVCDPNIGRMPELYDVSRFCWSGYRLPDGAWVRYEYYTHDLSDWHQIDEQVRALMSGFSRTQPAPG